MLRIGEYDIILVPILYCFHVFESLWDTYFVVMNALSIMHDAIFIVSILSCVVDNSPVYIWKLNFNATFTFIGKIIIKIRLVLPFCLNHGVLFPKHLF